MLQSEVSEFSHFWPVVEKSKKVPEAQILSDRLANFVDKQAHWAAALYSTQAVDIVMRKPLFAFFQITTAIVLVFLGTMLTLQKVYFERVS